MEKEKAVLLFTIYYSLFTILLPAGAVHAYNRDGAQADAPVVQLTLENYRPWTQALP